MEATRLIRYDAEAQPLTADKNKASRRSMSHLEDFIVEYYDWRRYLVKRNAKVGRLKHGGWEMELDVIAYHPHEQHLIHIEASLDAHPWGRREERFAKKFQAARRYVFSDIFTWLDPDTPMQQVAMLAAHPKGRDHLGEATIQSVDEFVAEVRARIAQCGIAAKSAIPEQYPLLRVLQLSHNGYRKVL